MHERGEGSEHKVEELITELTESGEIRLDLATLTPERRIELMDSLIAFATAEKRLARSDRRARKQLITHPENPATPTSLSEARDPDLQFFADRRVNGLVDLSVINGNSLRGKRRELFGGFKNFIYGIRENGDRSMEHLCLPRKSESKFYSKGIYTIDELESRLSSHTHTLNAEQELIVRMALAEFHELRKAAEESSNR